MSSINDELSDRTHPVDALDVSGVNQQNQCLVRQLIERWPRPVRSDRTRSVEEIHFWNLTGNDRTLEAERPVSLCSASGQ